MKKWQIGTAVAAAVLTIFGSAAASVATAAALTKPNSLAAELAQKFHLNQSDVQSVIDQHRQEEQSYHQQAYSQRLDAAVANGTITSTQKQQILDERQQIQSFISSLNGKSDQDKMTAIQTEIVSVQQWAQQNQIPLRLLIGGGLLHGLHPGHGMMGPNNDGNQNANPSSNASPSLSPLSPSSGNGGQSI